MVLSNGIMVSNGIILFIKNKFDQKHKKDSKKKHVKDIKIFLKKKTGKKRPKIHIKVFLKNKSRHYLSIGKNII